MRTFVASMVLLTATGAAFVVAAPNATACHPATQTQVGPVIITMDPGCPHTPVPVVCIEVVGVLPTTCVPMAG